MQQVMSRYREMCRLFCVVRPAAKQYFTSNQAKHAYPFLGMDTEILGVDSY